MGVLPVDYSDPPSHFDRRGVWKAVVPRSSVNTTTVPTPTANATDGGSPQPVSVYVPSRMGIIAAASLGGVAVLIVAFIFGAIYWKRRQEAREARREAPSTSVKRMLGLGTVETVGPEENGQQGGVQNINKYPGAPPSQVLALSRLPPPQTLPAGGPRPVSEIPDSELSSSHPPTSPAIYPMAEPTTPTPAPSSDPPCDHPAPSDQTPSLEPRSFLPAL